MGQKTETVEINKTTAHPILEHEEFHREFEKIKQQYLSILTDPFFKALEWETSTGGKYILHPSSRSREHWQLTFFNSQETPISDHQYRKDEVGKGRYNDLLMDLPHSGKDQQITIRVLYQKEFEKVIPSQLAAMKAKEPTSEKTVGDKPLDKDLNTH